MPAATDETLYLTPGELSGILLISDIEISRLARRGILPRIPSPTKSNSFLYPLVDCAREYVRHLKSAGQLDRNRYWKGAGGQREGEGVCTVDCECRKGQKAGGCQRC